MKKGTNHIVLHTDQWRRKNAVMNVNNKCKNLDFTWLKDRLKNT